MSGFFIRKKDYYPYERYLFLQEGLRKKRKELVLICEHLPVLTAGVNALEENLLSDEKKLAENQISIFRIKRGGDFTAHEPGQIVIYPHIDLKKRKIQLSPFVRQLFFITEESIREIWNIQLDYNESDPGLYLEKKFKIVSGGTAFKSFFTSHGISINIKNNLSTFKHIIPCGLKDIIPASLAEHGADVSRTEDFLQLWSQKFEQYLTEPPPSHMHS